MNYKNRINEIERRLNIQDLKTTWEKTAEGLKVKFDWGRDATPRMVTELKINGINDI